jgi:hypothetical protein
MVFRSTVEPRDRCYLIMDLDRAEYVGTLLVSYPDFCREICSVLIRNSGKTIREIGDIDLNYMC